MLAAILLLEYVPVCHKIDVICLPILEVFIQKTAIEKSSGMTLPFAIFRRLVAHCDYTLEEIRWNQGHRLFSLNECRPVHAHGDGNTCTKNIRNYRGLGHR